MKKILVLNGSTRAHGATKQLIDSFTEGAEKAGNGVHEIKTDELKFSGELYSNDQGYKKNSYNLDEVLSGGDVTARFSQEVLDADVIVFATPVYWWTISGSLKTAIDYTQPILQAVGFKKFFKESVLLVTAGGDDFSQPVEWYKGFEKYLGWKNLGEVLGIENIDQAREIGAEIQ